jgi:hypothetical protein
MVVCVVISQPYAATRLQICKAEVNFFRAYAFDRLAGKISQIHAAFLSATIRALPPFLILTGVCGMCGFVKTVNFNSSSVRPF